jgi:pilus assembly protein CpaF
VGRFPSAAALRAAIDRIVAPVGRRIDETQPLADARLPDGSRVHAVIPPLALDGPVLTIRKFAPTLLRPADLVRLGTLDARMAAFLEACVVARRSLLIAGGTGSGKTTTLNLLSAHILAEERIVTIEDAAELRLPQPHVVRLEARPPNIEGRGAVTIRELVRNALRMRPDRIVVGEVRGGEALDMLQAMNTGHDGSLTTVHANGPRDALARVETLALMAGIDLPHRAVREQVASAIHVVVYQARQPDGRRIVTAISEVAGLEGDVIALQDLFVAQTESTGTRFLATGLVPLCAGRLRDAGIPLDPALFRAG